MGVQRNLHRFFCTKCGEEGIPILREQGKQKSEKHLKKLFCIRCQEEVNHCEINEIGAYTVEMFKQDFENGLFNQ